MGMSILPIIFNTLDHNPTHWFIALAEITGVNPIPKESAGNVAKMIEAWKEYGRQQGYIK